MDALIWIVVLGGLVALGLFLYLRAVESRKHYRCPACGEAQTVELMQASHCSTCGAPLKRA